MRPTGHAKRQVSKSPRYEGYNRNAEPGGDRLCENPAGGPPEGGINRRGKTFVFHATSNSRQGFITGPITESFPVWRIWKCGWGEVCWNFPFGLILPDPLFQIPLAPQNSRRHRAAATHLPCTVLALRAKAFPRSPPPPRPPSASVTCNECVTPALRPSGTMPGLLSAVQFISRMPLAAI